MAEILVPVGGLPVHGKMGLSGRNPVKAVESLFIRVEDDGIFPFRSGKTVIGKRLRGVEIEGEDGVPPHEDQDLFLLVGSEQDRGEGKELLLLAILEKLIDLVHND